MYIGSTNISFNSSVYNANVMPSWITSEKYYNCENFYNQITTKQKKRKLFTKK